MFDKNEQVGMQVKKLKRDNKNDLKQRIQEKN